MISFEVSGSFSLVTTFLDLTSEIMMDSCFESLDISLIVFVVFILEKDVSIDLVEVSPRVAKELFNFSGSEAFNEDFALFSRTSRDRDFLPDILFVIGDDLITNEDFSLIEIFSRVGDFSLTRDYSLFGSCSPTVDFSLIGDISRDIDLFLDGDIIFSLVFTFSEAF